MYVLGNVLATNFSGRTSCNLHFWYPKYEGAGRLVTIRALGVYKGVRTDFDVKSSKAHRRIKKHRYYIA